MESVSAKSRVRIAQLSVKVEYYAKLAKTYGVPAMIWDNGAKGAGEERHAFIDHGTGEYCSTEAKAAIRALVSSYTNSLTLDDVYRNAPK